MNRLLFSVAELLLCTGHANVLGLPDVASYKVRDQWGEQSGIPGQSVSGYYSWQNGGTVVRVDYTADKNGYRPVARITSGQSGQSSQFSQSSQGSEFTKADVDRFLRVWEEFSRPDRDLTRGSNATEKPVLITSPSQRLLFPLNLFSPANNPILSVITSLGSISQNDVQQAEKNWGDKIVQMGRVKDNPGALDKAAEEALNLYAWDLGPVLFKPTRASDNQFRLTREGAKSYFIGHNSHYPEDEGFALQPWTNVRFENAAYILDKNRAIAMGNYYFRNQNGVETKVEYTFGFVRRFLSGLKIELQHSSLPYKKPAAVI